MIPTSKLLYNQEELANISDILLERFDEIIERTEIKLTKDAGMYSGCCPIHCGDNPTAFTLNRPGNKYAGMWKCWTHHCERVFRPSLVGFIRAMLSSRSKSCEWRTEGDRTYSFKQTIEWINNFLGEDRAKISNKREANLLNSFGEEIKKEPPKGLDVSIIKERLKIPSYYFVKRGYSEEVLYNYMVGYCDTKGKRQYKRSVVPVLNDDSTLMMASTGRSIYEECPNCKLHHCTYFPCPKFDFAHMIYCKWKHLGDVGGYLYNYWNAKKYIKKTKTAVLVEGAGDVWKLEELGIKNAVGLFGTNLTDAQSLILETSGAMNLVDMLDNDSAGREAAEKIRKETERIYRWHRYNYIGKDPGQLTKETVKPIKEFLEKLK